MASDCFVSTASISMGGNNGGNSNREHENKPRPHPSPSFYHTGAHPIHPVLQRRNTPLRLGRRVTQPVNFTSSNTGGAREENENLSCDKTGRLPIPPPRGPKYRTPVTRNVSQNGLRSPKLSPKPPRAGFVGSTGHVTSSPGSRYETSGSLESWGIRPSHLRSDACEYSKNVATKSDAHFKEPCRPTSDWITPCDSPRTKNPVLDHWKHQPPKLEAIPLSREDSENGTPKGSNSGRPVGSNGIYGVPRRSKFYIDIPAKDSPPSTPSSQVKASDVGRNGPARIRKVLLASPPINYPNHRRETQISPARRPNKQSFDEIVDEIFKTIGSSDEIRMDNYEDLASRRRQQQSSGAKLLLRQNRVGGVNVLSGGVNGLAQEPLAHDNKDEEFSAMEQLMNSSPNTADAYCIGKDPSRINACQYSQDIKSAGACSVRPTVDFLALPIIHRSKSDVSRDKLRFKRRLSSLLPTATTVPDNLCMQDLQEPKTREWMEESTEFHYSPDENVPDTNVMQRMRKTLTNLRSGMMARLQKTPQYAARKSSYQCDVVEEPDVSDQCIFYDIGREDGLLKPVDPTQNLDRTRKPTSADSGIMDVGQDGDDLSSSSRHARPTSSDYSSDSPMRRSRSQPPNRLVSFTSAVSGGAATDEKSSDLDRSVSARSSRTSEVSDSSASPAICSSTQETSSQVPASPLYIESLWSQVKYEVDCQQHISECSPEGMRANIVKEIVKNERDFVNNLRDVIEGYLYKCRQRSDMFSKGRIECIFGNIEQLYEFQCEFLADLEASLIVNNIHRSEIGHCFLLHQRGFSDLYSDYCNLHTQSASELLQLKQIKQYAHFFEACRMLQEMVEISLDGFLLQPVQKICKYPLQLTELLKYTPEDHPDCQSVKLALKAMKSVTGMINERKRRLECLEKIALWQETIDNWEGDDLVEQSSQLIHYGDLNKLSSKNSWTHEYTFFLFDHQLIYCRRDIIKRTLYTYKGRFELDQVEIVDVEQNDVTGIKHGWVMACPDKALSTIILAKSLDEKTRWMEAFKDERRRVQTDMINGFAIAPKDRLAAIQVAKMLTAGKEKRSKTKDALKDLTDHTQLDQSMRSKSISMTLPLRIRAGQASRNPFSHKMPSFGHMKKS